MSSLSRANPPRQSQILVVTVLIAIAAIAGPSARAQRIALPKDFYPRILQHELEELHHFHRGERTSSSTHPGSAHALDASEHSITPETEPYPESEIHAAINPTDSSNIVVSPMRNGPGIGKDCLNFPIYYTHDFGKTWKQSAFQALPLAMNYLINGGGDPMFGFDADGKLYFMWLTIYYNNDFTIQHFGLYWAVSLDGGATWQRDTTNVIGYNANTNGYELTIWDKEWMAIDRNNTPWHNTVYAAFALADSSRAVVQLLRKKPDQTRFDVTATISDTNLAFAQWTTIGVDRKGAVHVIYTGTYDTVHFALYHVVSHDGGTTFSKQQLVSPIHLWWWTRSSGEDSIIGTRKSNNYPCSQLVVDTARDGNIYLAWSCTGRDSNEHHGSQIFFSRSTDYGETWSKASVLNDDGTAQYRHHFYPSLAINGKGVLVASWYDRRDDPNNILTHYYYAESTDGGLSWSRNRAVTSQPTDYTTTDKLNYDFSTGEYTQLLATDHVAVPIWSDGRTGDGDLKVYCAFVDLAHAAAGGVQVSPVTDKFSLLDIVPNPARNRCTITYELHEPSSLSLELIDATGKVVHTETFGMQAIGPHSLTLNLDGVSNGAYFVRLRSSFGYAVRTMEVKESLIK